MSEQWTQILTAYPGIWSEADYRKLHKEPEKVKADPSQFGAWLAGQPESTHSIIKPLEGGRWGKISRLVYVSVYLEQGQFVSKGTPNAHKFYQLTKQRRIICLDPESQFAGNIYNNNSKFAIYVKLVASILGRPLHLVLKTLYHLSLISVAIVIFNGIKKEQSADKIGQKIIRSLADIVRTPVYDVAILIVTLSGLIAAPFKPELVYDFRAVISRLSRELTWGQRKEFVFLGGQELTPCMQPTVNIMEYTLNEQQIKNRKRPYIDTTNPVLVAFDNRDP